MKICPGCGAPLSEHWECTSCRWKAVRQGGYLAFAPDLAQSNKGFEPGYFAELAALENGNFWFEARNKLLVWSLKRFFPKADSMLEVGCGTGYVLSGIKKAFPRVRLSGSEIYCNGLEYASSRMGDAALFQMDARKIPFIDEFDVIGAFDVLEHIEEDEQVLRQIHWAVKPGGGMILTAPQHPFLWSRQDKAACHVRRYRRLELQEKVERAGFRLEMTTSFVSLLLPLMMLSRFRKRNEEDHYDPMAELKLGNFTNMIFGNIMRLERTLIQSGVTLPAGGSLLLIAIKS